MIDTIQTGLMVTIWAMLNLILFITMVSEDQPDG